MIPIDFQVTCSRSRSNRSLEHSMLSAPYLLTLSLNQYQTWGMGWRPKSRWSLFIFRLHVQRSRSNHSSQLTVLSMHRGGIYVSETCCVIVHLSPFDVTNQKTLPSECLTNWKSVDTCKRITFHSKVSLTPLTTTPIHQEGVEGFLIFKSYKRKVLDSD